MKGHKAKSINLRNSQIRHSFAFKTTSLETISQARVFDFRRLFFLFSFLILILIVLSSLKYLHKIPLCFTFKVL